LFTDDSCGFGFLQEERDDLVEQLRLLEARLELLQLKAGVSTLGDDKSIASLEAEKARVDAEIRGNLDLFARLHSLVTHRLVTHEQASKTPASFHSALSSPFLSVRLFVFST
jgi:hypothetical protein